MLSLVWIDRFKCYHRSERSALKSLVDVSAMHFAELAGLKGRDATVVPFVLPVSSPFVSVHINSGHSHLVGEALTWSKIVRDGLVGCGQFAMLGGRSDSSEH